MEVTQEFINRLRMGLDEEMEGEVVPDAHRSIVLSCFDRAALGTILAGGETTPQPLTRGQKAARTRARNKKLNGKPTQAQADVEVEA